MMREHMAEGPRTPSSCCCCVAGLQGCWEAAMQMCTQVMVCGAFQACVTCLPPGLCHSVSRLFLKVFLARADVTPLLPCRSHSCLYVTAGWRGWEAASVRGDAPAVLIPSTPARPRRSRRPEAQGSLCPF